MLRAMLAVAIVLRQQQRREMKLCSSVGSQRGAKDVSKTKPKEKISNREGLVLRFLLAKQGTVQMLCKLESSALSWELL